MAVITEDKRVVVSFTVHQVKKMIDIIDLLLQERREIEQTPMYRLSNEQVRIAREDTLDMFNIKNTLEAAKRDD